ncbi:MAG: hypothetical protein KDD78_06390 [Caldilineaceae bacterium]|nr:hypothetical protein [Caldilineaceae bacterium]
MKNRHYRTSYLFWIVAAATGIALLLTLLLPADHSKAENGTLPDAETAQDLYLPLLLHQLEPRPKSLFGVQVYGDTRRGSANYNALVASDADWYRAEIGWSQVEPTNREPADFNWTAPDRVVGAVYAKRYNMIATLNFAPEWASSATNGPIDKVDISEFVEFVSAVVERYDGDGIDDMRGSPVVEYFEFYNEPDRVVTTDERSGWGEDPQAYARMLAAVYPAVKAANPDAKVLLGGIAYDWFTTQGGHYARDFLPRVLDEGGGPFFDIMNFHGYPPFAVNWLAAGQGGPALYEKILAVRELMGTYGLNKPIIISEAGMHSNDTSGNTNVWQNMTEELQARYVVQLFTESAAGGVDTMIWFSLVDPPAWYAYQNGLITSEEPATNKLGFQAYRIMDEMLDGVTPVAAARSGGTNGDDLQVYTFNKTAPARTLYVAWLNPVNTDQTTSLTVPGGAASITTIYGATSTVVDDDDGRKDGRVTVSVGGQPIYIEVIN